MEQNIKQLTDAQSLLCEQEMGPVPIQLADAFGLVIQCRDMVGEHALLIQTVHTLQQAVQPGKPLYSSCWEFSTQDYKEVNKHVLSPSHLHCFYIKRHCPDFSVYMLTINCDNFLSSW